MQHRVYHRQIYSVDELKLRLIDVWCGLEQSIFDKTIIIIIIIIIINSTNLHKE